MPESTVMVGTGIAGATAALTLREDGFAGRIVLIGEEPYDPVLCRARTGGGCLSCASTLGGHVSLKCTGFCGDSALVSTRMAMTTRNLDPNQGLSDKFTTGEQPGVANYPKRRPGVLEI
ncbi:MAG TPA: hypothetical protein VGP70_16020, partial [Actinomadura sp.]|nr:hypothetical protein [Actinomadura sp.]